MNTIAPEAIQRALDRTLPSFPVVFAYLFGSSAHGATHSESDFDIAVAFIPHTAEAKRDELLLDILQAVNRELNIPTERLDIQDFSRLPLAVRFRVVRDGQLLYVADAQTHRELVLNTISRYHDEQPITRALNQAVLERTAAL